MVTLQPSRSRSNWLVVALLALLVQVQAQEVPEDLFLDNRESCAHRVLNCDPTIDHFDTKISMDHASSVSRLECENTHVLLEQSWPTRGPWMKNTTQRIVFVRCGCPIPKLSPDWAEANVIHVPVSSVMVQMPNTLTKLHMMGQRSKSWPTRGPWMKNTTQRIVFVRCGCPIPKLSPDWAEANVIHVPVSSVMVQMPNTLTKLYMMGQRSKVKAIESNRWISEATPEIQTDVRDGILRRLDLAPNGVPSTRVTISFANGYFRDASDGFRLQLTQNVQLDGQDDESEVVLGETDCIYPHLSDGSDGNGVLDHSVLDAAFNSIPGWVDAGNVWVLASGEPSVQPSTSLSYTLYFDNQLPMDLNLKGEATTCHELASEVAGEVTSVTSEHSNSIEFKIDRDFAPNNRPIYHRLHDLPGGFPDVLITEPRSLGPLADDPKILKRQFLDSDPGEQTPLGRAELMKLVALMVGSEATGNTLFETIETRYNGAKEIASRAKTRPTVMVGKPGTWNEAARNSWMVTVGSTYVGQFLRDANVEYRNSDDKVNQKLCGSGCGVCPSGTSDTRCSVAIGDYLDLFRSADYWISAGIGANCWSGSCNFAITADNLLDENREIFSQFLPMRCNSVIGLDKSQQNGGSNQYWELGRLRPDIVLTDLVTLMHPDLGISPDETTFFRMLPPLSNTTGVESCPRTILPPVPDSGTVHVTSTFAVELSGTNDEIIGASRFAVLERFYPYTNTRLAEALGVDDEDVAIAMRNNNNNKGGGEDDSAVTISVTVRVTNCKDHSCGVDVGSKLDALGPDIEKALDLNWVMVERDASESTLVLDREGDIIPLEALLSDDLTVSTTAGDAKTSDPGDSKGLSSGAIAGIIVGVVAAFLIAVFATYKVAYAQGAKDTIGSYESKKETNDTKEGPPLVSEAMS